MRSGLVESMNRPGKATGVNFFTGDLGGKRLELLCSMVPSIQRVGLLLNPRFGAEPSEQLQAIRVCAAQSLGRELVAQSAGNGCRDRVGACRAGRAGVGGLVVQNDPFFDTPSPPDPGAVVPPSIARTFSTSASIPADGGLMSYGASLSDTYRQVGVYAGKILRGAKPDDLPVLRPTKFELVINAQTAKTLGLAVPQPMLIASDELIE